MKPLVHIISRDEADGRIIAQAAQSQGCRAAVSGSAADALSSFTKEIPSLIFCDASLAEGGGALRSLTEACSGSDVSIILLVRHGEKDGLLKSLRPWVHDFLASPVLREAVSIRIKNTFRMKKLEQDSVRAASSLTGWLSRLETAIRCFDPLRFDGTKAWDDLARRLVRTRPDESHRPACLLIGVPDGAVGLDCALYGSAAVGESVSARFKLPLPAVFLSMGTEEGLACLNYFDRGARLEDFQSVFPPDLLKATGAIYNLVGFVHAGVYVAAFNYGRPVTAEDALFLKGLALPGSFLGSVACEVRGVSESFLVMAQALAVAADSQNDNGAHVRRMNQYARILAEHLSLPGQFVQALSYSAQLHDVGKIYLHPDLLEKPLRLTAHEFDRVKKHPVLGAKILGDSPLLRVARNIALTHHECWDGSGYPEGLSGEAIPLEGAIVKLADVYDALRTIHTYKSPYSHDDACQWILHGGGDELHEIRPAHFHPDVLKAFKDAAGKFEEIYQTNRS